MSGLSGFEITVIVFVIFLAIVIVALLLYLLRRLRVRRKKILNELDNSPQLQQDRAFNRLAMARREAAVLAQQGVDVHRAQELIAESQGAFDTRHYDRAYEVAQSAHEALVRARAQGGRGIGPTPSSAPLPSTVGSAAPSAPAPSIGFTAPVAARASEPRPTLAKNQAESQFQIRLLNEELEALPARRKKDPTVVQANEFERQASQAFEKSDYTEAFRLALKGRRALGGSLESLPLSGAGDRADEGGPGESDDMAEALAGSERCPACGYPMPKGDDFCRGCGRPRGTMTCPSCGAPRGADEPYCGRCGARFP